MEVTFLPQDYIINITRKVNSGIESDILLRAIRIKNDGSDVVRIKEISFDLKINGGIVKRVVYPEQTVRGLCRTIAKNLPKMHGLSAQLFLGTEKFWDKDYIASTSTLKSNQGMGILLEHFKVFEKYAVDEVVVSVHYLQKGKKHNCRCGVPIIQYQNKNKYIFPLKGTYLVVNNYDSIHIHRRMHSQEFAMDIVQLTNDFRLSSKKARTSDNTNYQIYGKEVYAVADGEVIDCFWKFPENPPGFGSRLPKQEWDRLKKKYGFVAWLAGNYIILKHSGKEYSFYAHMIPRSLTVKPGDLVKQGQVIGLVGNSGNSDAPHLHFHLMNGPNLLYARGLPCRFTNLKNMIGKPLLFIEENNSIVHAE